MSTLDFHQFCTKSEGSRCIGFRFPLKTSKASDGQKGLFFEATLQIWGEFFSYLVVAVCHNTSSGLKIGKISVDCSVHIFRRPCSILAHAVVEMIK